MFLLRAHYASPIDYTDEALEQARAACETLRNRLRDRGRPRARRCEQAFREALDDDFNTPEGAGAAVRRAAGGGRAPCAELLGVLGLGGLAARGAGAAEGWSSRRSERRAGARRARLRAGRRAARRDRRRPAGRCATRPTARASTAVAADVVYGRHPVREALRGRREVLRVWCAPRAGRRRSGSRRAPRGRRPTALDARPAAPTTRAWSPRWRPTPTPTPTSCSPATGRCWWRSTRSPTRTTWAPSPGWPSARARTAC